MIDMTIKLSSSTNHTTNMFTTELHICKQQLITCLFHVSLNISNTLVDIVMYMKLHKILDFDGPMCTHVFKCLKTIYFTCKQKCTPVIRASVEALCT